jgi:hypothetical protein
MFRMEQRHATFKLSNNLLNKIAQLHFLKIVQQRNKCTLPLTDTILV